VFHTNDTGLLLAIRGIAKQQSSAAEKPEEQNDEQPVEELHSI
jgi:hypothetical protein